MSRRARFEVFRGDDGQWYWRLRAANGEIVSQSEGYTTRASARRGVEAARRATSQAADSGSDYGAFV